MGDESIMPAKKEDYTKVFNKLFDTNIEWHRLKLEDLITLATLFNNPELIISKFGGKLEKQVTRKRLVDVGVEMFEEIIDKWEGPLATLYKKLVGEKEKET